MRVVFVTSSYPFGPAESFLHAEIDAVRQMGNDVLIVPVRPRGGITDADARTIARFAESQGLLSPRVLAVAVAEAATRQAGMRGMTLGGGRTLRRNLAALPKALWLGRIASNWKANHIHAYWGSVPATVAWIAARRARVSWSFTLHRWDIYESNLLAEKLEAASFARVIAHRARDVVVSRHSDSRPPRVLHLGVRTDVPVGPLPIAKRELRMLVPAALVPVKGHSHLLDALSQLKDLPLVVDFAGVGPAFAQLRSRARALSVDHMVRFLGLVPHATLMERLSSGEWDGVVLPSIERGELHEGIPISLAEAMARGVPVVATDSGFTSELVDDHAGLLVPPGSPRHLAAAIRELAESIELRSRLSSSGRLRVRRDFDARDTAKVLTEWMEATAKSAAVP